MEKSIAKLATRRIAVPGKRARLVVPQHIVRIDSEHTHGWQVRYRNATKFFADLKLGGVEESLAAARKHLAAIYIGPVTRLLGQPSKRRSKYGVGISFGARKRLDRGWTEYKFNVLIPRFGGKPKVRSIYIGTSRDYTQERLLEALQRARRARRAGERAYIKARDRVA
jgi:hypothetical protein